MLYPAKRQIYHFYFSAFLFMRLVLSVIISPFLASSSSSPGHPGSDRLNSQETTFTTEETTTRASVETFTTTEAGTFSFEGMPFRAGNHYHPWVAAFLRNRGQDPISQSSVATRVETSSTPEEPTWSTTTIETSTTTEPGTTTFTFEGMAFRAAYHDHQVIAFLRERAQAQISQRSGDHNVDPFCVAHEDVIPDLMRNVLSSIRTTSGLERTRRCSELNMGKFLQIVCPEYWTSRKQHIHSLAVQQALLCSSSLGTNAIVVDRSRIIDTTFYHLGSETDYRKSMMITFAEELGSDAGGLFKDWVTNFATESMVEDDYLFELDGDTNKLEFARRKAKGEHHIQRLTSIGKFLGIVARRDQATAPISLPLVYYSKLLDKPLMWDSLSEEEKRLTDFHATMLMDSNPMDDEILGEIWTLENRLELVNRAINTLSEDDLVKIGYVKSGLVGVLSEDVMNLLSPQDLQGMIEGDSEIDPEDLLRNKILTSSSISHTKGYTDTVQWFERLVRGGVDQKDLKKLVQFVTGLAKPPLGGFSKLNPKFTLNIYDGRVSHLPTAHTCTNTIDIPIYESEGHFIAKLGVAINSDAAMGAV
jgi:hypothetical protein